MGGTCLPWAAVAWFLSSSQSTASPVACGPPAGRGAQGQESGPGAGSAEAPAPAKALLQNPEDPGGTLPGEPGQHSCRGSCSQERGAFGGWSSGLDSGWLAVGTQDPGLPWPMEALSKGGGSRLGLSGGAGRSPCPRPGRSPDLEQRSSPHAGGLKPQSEVLSLGCIWCCRSALPRPQGRTHPGFRGLPVLASRPSPSDPSSISTQLTPWYVPPSSASRGHCDGV